MANIVPILLFGLSAGLTPGPNNFMLMNSGLQFGIKRTIPHYLGVCFGFPIMLFAIALGAGAVFAKYHWVYLTVKVLGCSYMMYFAWKIATSSSKTTTESAKPLNFIQAALFQWANPKAWVMGIGAIALFATASHHLLIDASAISFIFLILTFFSAGTWMLFGAALHKLLKNEKHRKIFNYFMAICLVASIVMIIL